MRVLRFFEGQAFEPDTLALRGSGVRLESLTYRVLQSRQTIMPAVGDAKI